MKTEDILIKKNIENLTALWKTAGEAFQSYINNTDYEYVEIPRTEWPNKIWFDHDITKVDTMLALRQNDLATVDLVIPYWDIFGSDTYKVLEACGFKEKSRQIAMCLELDEKFEEQKRLDFKRVTSKEEIKQWTELYPKAFGYSISEKIIQRTFNDISYYLAFLQSEPVGTAILFRTEEVIGIHGVGISPNARRSGYAEEIMKFLLNRSIDMGAKYVTLQASDMGKGLYDKLGFKTQFVIRNYFNPIFHV